MLAILLLLHGMLMPVHGVSAGALTAVCTSAGMQWVEAGDPSDSQDAQPSLCVWCQLQGAVLPAVVATRPESRKPEPEPVSSRHSIGHTDCTAFTRPPAQGPPAIAA
jgi:hypothetical protein